MPVFAAEDTNKDPELTVQTDKSEYSDTDSISEIVNVNNLSMYTLTNIEIKAQIPEGYVTNDGNGSKGEWIYTISQIAAGGSSEASVVFTPSKSNDTPGTGDISHPELWIFALAISAGCIVLVIKKKKGKKVVAFLLALTMIGAMVPAISMNSAYAAETGQTGKTITSTKDIKVDGKTVTLSVQMTYETQAEELSYDGYNLKWQDDFSEETLNRDDWNVELHNAGWVNEEKQAYVDSDENIYLEDGKLVLKPVKTVDENGDVTYTSGRVNTQNKHDFKYGIFEARVKVPEGQGYLPAFWLMASDENVYGQWPRCGEIDAMEVMGQDTSTAYGTIHYGNPHKETQGTATLSGDSFSDSYHTFAVEWLPGKINWYLDGVLYHTADNWYSRTEGQGEITYPAPFDQQFYMILNLAVGGSWVGNPDETTSFEDQAYSIDYVKVYQKDSYDENVTKPENSVSLREPDANGNYINNSDFSTAEDLTDDVNWKFLNALGGDAQAVISNNRININIANEGTVDYSVQLVQPNIPLKKGGNYQVTFDAWADADRTMKVGVTGPDNGYVRYMSDTKLNLTTTKNSYTFDFTMSQDDDANGRMEFNMGNAGSTANIHITNVKIKKISQSDGSNDKKTVLADGNSVYNGNFQEGVNHLGFWNFTSNNAKYSVTPLENGRRLKIEALAGTSAANPVVISQDGLALTANTDYAFSFKAEGESGKGIQAAVAGQTYAASLDGKYNTYNFKFKMPTTDGVNNIAFNITEPGVYYIDEVRIVEDTLIKNGSFNAGLAGYEPYADTTADASFGVDSLTEANAAAVDINDTGDQGWKIQLKQNNVELVKDQWYRLTLYAKSNISRQLMFAIQRDGSKDNNWDPYSGEKIVDLTSDYQKFTIEFKMEKDTDLHSILSISMGAINNNQITQQHQICIDNIKLEKIAAPAAPTIPSKPIGVNLLNNSDFANGVDGWENAITAPGAATATFTDNKATYSISNVGTADWNVQLKQNGITLEKGHKYKVTFKANSTESRTIKLAMLTAKYAWYGGGDIELTKDVTKDVVVEFDVTEPDNDAITMVVSMGIIDGINTPASTIILSDFSLVKVQ